MNTREAIGLLLRVAEYVLRALLTSTVLHGTPHYNEALKLHLEVRTALGAKK